jgi:hypothetical protein
MSFVYYSLLSTIGPPLVAAQAQSQSRWTSPQKLTSALTYLDSLDFADYDQRRAALLYLKSLDIPQFFYTYPFDPLQYPLAPPTPQVRFPSPGTFVNIGSAPYQTPLANLEASLSYRDTDGPIAPVLLVYTTAVLTLASLVSTREQYFDRATWELASVLVWSIYPPPFDGLQFPPPLVQPPVSSPP